MKHLYLVLPALFGALLAACSKPAHDPLATALLAGKSGYRESSVPAACYGKTTGGANACWTCHTVGVGMNRLVDVELQSVYSFSETAKTNHWQNLFEDRRAAVATMGDDEILAYVRQDNYRALRVELARRPDYPGFVPDLDLQAGFDAQGFARDRSGWRALRYKPFPGGFWPTNGSAGDAFIRLPEAFQKDATGHVSTDVYKLNLALLEAALATPASRADGALDRTVEPVSEALAGFDLDGNGTLGEATRINTLPEHYAGAAHAFRVRRFLYPRGTELLHTVRYLDPERPELLAARMKEVRYSRKVEEPDDWAIGRAYEHEADEKDEGRLPLYSGAATVGLKNSFGWQLQGFIEDAEGRLRLQTEEEHRFCMGCHSGVGVTVDHTFAFPRKVPGAAGFRLQDVRGIPDVPQAGHADPETLVYFRRARGGDDFRGNTELLARFFPDGKLDEAEVRRAAPGGDRDLGHLIVPSRGRALLLDKAYRALVRQQRFDRGRDALPEPALNVHAKIEEASTGLAARRRVYDDGRLQLDWGAAP